MSDARHVAPDQAARDRIERKLDTTMLVEAAAGTGKTTSLVRRMIALVREERCPVESLAAITFTRKAAGELGARFRLGIEAQAASATGVQRETLVAALGLLERCFIGTIHSFCARLLRERPVEAGVALDFTEIEEDEDQAIRAEAWSRTVAAMHERGDPIVHELEEVGVDLADLGDVFARVVAGFPDVERWPAEPAPMPVGRLAAARGALTEYLGHLRRLMPTLEEPGTDKLQPRMAELQRRHRQGGLDHPARLMELLDILRLQPANAVVHKWWPGKKAQALAELSDWNRLATDHAQPLLDLWREHRYPVVMRALLGAREVYDSLRRDLSALNFQDLLMVAARLLREKPNVRAYFRHRYRYLLVDEFQDTDPVQAEVMMLLTAYDPCEKRWTHCRPVKGSLFVVGDPKQSIYRFRRADIQTYTQVKDIIRDAGGALIDLTASFRTVAPLIDWTNDTFRKIFPEKPDAYSPRHVQMQCTRPASAATLEGLFALPVDGRQFKEALVVDEAQRIATFIQSAIERLTVQRRTDPPSISPLQAGDFMILTAQKKRMAVYARALESRAIPYTLTGGAMLSDCQELRLLHACLTAVLAPDDPVAVVAVLRGALFGLSDTDLYCYHRAGGRFHYLTPRVPAAQPWSSAFADAFARLARYAAWAEELPPIAAAWRVAGDLGLLESASTSTAASLRTGSLAKALELACSRKTEIATMAQLVVHLEEMLDPESELDAMPARPHAQAAVRIMNLHKAKGLEAPVVFLADPTGPEEHPPHLHVRREGASPTGYLLVECRRGFQADVIAQPRDWSIHAQEETAFLSAERDRLRYVAATRAQSALIVTRPVNARGGSLGPYGALVEALDRAQELPPVEPSPPTPATVIDVSPDESAAALASIESRWLVVAGSTYAIEPATEASRPVPRATASTKSLGAEWGSAIHSLLELAAREAATPSALKSMAETLFIDQDLPFERLAEALQLVESVKASRIYARWLASPRRLAEVPLSVLAPSAPSQPPTLLRGVIDLVFEEDGAWVIVDYKTDKVLPGASSHLLPRYRPQLDAYARMWTLATRMPVKERALFFVTSGEYLRVDSE